MEPTAQFNISPPPWKTATMLDFLRYDLYSKMPFLSFYNHKSFDRETQAFLENDSVEEILYLDNISLFDIFRTCRV